MACGDAGYLEEEVIDERESTRPWPRQWALAFEAEPTGVAPRHLARTVTGMERDAPWLDDDQDWSIFEVSAASLRPGWWCHTQERMAFVAICGVTVLMTGRGRVVFVDLADGRTLALDETASVIVRRRTP